MHQIFTHNNDKTMIEDFLAAMEQMSDEDFGRLLDEVRPYGNVGPTVEEYMDLVDENTDSPYIFVYDRETTEIKGNPNLFLAA